MVAMGNWFLLLLGGVIHVQVEGANVTGLPVSFYLESGEAVGECLTDANGRCDIVVTDVDGGDVGLIRGYLSVGNAGYRSIVWPGGAVDVALSVEASGLLFVPGHEDYDEGDSAINLVASPVAWPTLVYVPAVETRVITVTQVVTVEVTPTTAVIAVGKERNEQSASFANTPNFFVTVMAVLGVGAILVVLTQWAGLWPAFGKRNNKGNV